MVAGKMIVTRNKAFIPTTIIVVMMTNGCAPLTSPYSSDHLEWADEFKQNNPPRVNKQQHNYSWWVLTAFAHFAKHI